MSNCLILSILAAFLGQQARAAVPLCPGLTTPEVEACLQSKLDHIDAELQRYTDAAVDRIKQEDPSEVLASFHEGETAWTKYRDAECGAVYDYWSRGTVRGAMSIVCATHLTEARTHEVWFNWLTYVDSTPPLLPELTVETGR